MVSFKLTNEPVFFSYETTELLLLEEIVDLVKYASRPTGIDKPISSHDIRNLIIKELLLIAELCESDFTLNIDDTKKFFFKFPDKHRSRHSYTMSNYCRLSRFLRQAIRTK